MPKRLMAKKVSVPFKHCQTAILCPPFWRFRRTKIHQWLNPFYRDIPMASFISCFWWSNCSFWIKLSELSVTYHCQGLAAIPSASNSWQWPGVILVGSPRLFFSEIDWDDQWISEKLLSFSQHGRIWVHLGDGSKSKNRTTFKPRWSMYGIFTNIGPINHPVM